MNLSVKSVVVAACAVAVLVAIPAWAQERGGETCQRRPEI